MTPSAPLVVAMPTRRAARPRQHDKRAQRVEEVLLVLGPRDAVLLQRAVENFVVGGERAGMRGRRLDAVLGAARLEHNDRRALSHLARLVEKRARIADTLDVEADDLGRRIVGDVVQKIELVDVDLVADVDALAHRQALDRARHDIEHQRAGENAGLGKKRHAARLPAREIDEAAHHADLGIDHADRVGPRQQQAGCVRDLAQPLLVDAALLTRLGKSRRDDAGRARAGGDTLLDGVLDMLLRQHDVDEIDLLRHFGERGVGLEPHDLRRGAVDRIERAAGIFPWPDCRTARRRILSDWPRRRSPRSSAARRAG